MKNEIKRRNDNFDKQFDEVNKRLDERLSQIRNKNVVRNVVLSLIHI